jgi:hypothetical protein
LNLKADRETNQHFGARRNINEFGTATGMEKKSLEELLRLRAYYLWEADGRPEGRSHEYWERARATLAADALSVALLEQVSIADSSPEKPAKKPAKAKASKPATKVEPKDEPKSAPKPKASSKSADKTGKTAKPVKAAAKSAGKPVAKDTPKASVKTPKKAAK